MSNEKTKKRVRRKITKKRKKNKGENKVKPEKVTSLSKQKASVNWLTFIGPNGLKSTLKNMNVINKSTEFKKKLHGPSNRKPEETKVIALDCEMVSDLNNENMLARVSLVNFRLECIYDKYVKPTSKVGDFRTRFSGIREEDLTNGADLEDVRREVKQILINKILVGHALHNDFKVLKFGHHKQLIRDTSRYEPFKKVNDMKPPPLKKLAKVLLNENIQEGEHSSIEDAKTAMKLYKKYRKEWEVSLLSSKSKGEIQIQEQ